MISQPIKQTVSNLNNNSNNTHNNNNLTKTKTQLNENKNKEQLTLTINKFSVNISNNDNNNNNKEKANSVPKEEESQNEIDNEDEMLIMEIMQKVEEENKIKNDKHKHVGFNLDENILIKYNDKNNITSLDIVKEKTNEKIKFVQHRMNIYNKILKSTNKPKGIIKPFNVNDIKTDFSFVPEYYPDEDDTEEEKDYEENEDEDKDKDSNTNDKVNSGELVKNIRKMFDDDENEGDDEYEDS
jgi:hypothetical protein